MKIISPAVGWERTWKVLKKEERKRTRRPEKRRSRSGKESGRKEREKRLLLKEGVSTFFYIDAFAFEEFSPVEDSDSCGDSWSDVLGDSCGLFECVFEVMCLF